MFEQRSKTPVKNKEFDLWETPHEVYHELCRKFKVNPLLDVACIKKNGKCVEGYYFDERMDGLSLPWTKTVWCNPPHSNTEIWVRKAFAEWKKNNITIMMLLPTNTMSTNFWHECIEGKAEYHPIQGRIKFLKNDKTSRYPSRNAYLCVIWNQENGHELHLKGTTEEQ